MLGVFFKGLMMGISDIIPGVSGGTMALILGVYERLMTALGYINVRFLLPLFRYVNRRKKRDLRDFKQAFSSMDPLFLVVLGAGIFSALFLGSFFIPLLLERFPSFMYAFFAGLIVGSMYVILFKRVGPLSFRGVLWGVVGFMAGFVLTSANWLIGSHSLPVIFVSGFFAICAMLLPGISGSYVLLMLGQYEYMLRALHELRIVDAGTFIMGGIVALLAMSRLIAYLLNRWHAGTLLFLVGLMAGSLHLLLAQVTGWIPLLFGVAGFGVVAFISGKEK
ncbi:MAG: DUF368 domain-containing protein [Nanobdellota archaeon]